MSDDSFLLPFIFCLLPYSYPPFIQYGASIDKKQNVLTPSLRLVRPKANLPARPVWSSSQLKSLQIITAREFVRKWWAPTVLPISEPQLMFTFTLYITNVLPLSTTATALCWLHIQEDRVLSHVAFVGKLYMHSPCCTWEN